MKRTLGWVLFGFILVACTAMNRSEAQPKQDKAAIVETTKKVLAGRLSVRPESIELVGEVEAVTWPDASLGCPEPGMMYAQVLTPGYRFTLQSGGTLYRYHTGGDVVKLCDR